jgi:sulfite reductase (NADPH) flavoprotein alpha-component
MAVSEFRGPGLTEGQWQQIKTLATSLDAKQLLWLSGYLAGLEQGSGEYVGAAAMPSAEPAVVGRTLTVLYGTETGNSAGLAAMIVERAKARNLTARLCDMAAYKIRELKDEQDLLIITSTHGEGDPPQTAAGFFEFVEGRKAPKFSDLRFAVLSLGDSTYEFYCEAGKRIDRRMEELGGERLMPRVDCDVDYDEDAVAWTQDILDRFARGTARTRSAAPEISSALAPVEVSSFDKRNPFSARIIDNVVLTGRGSSKEVRHIELSLEGSGLTFEPGDALGIMPSNDPRLISTILDELDFDATTILNIKEEPIALGKALARHFEITSLTPRFLDLWAKITDSAELNRLVRTKESNERAAFMRGHHLIDVVRRFRVKNIDAKTFVSGLRPLQPRLYSVASSLSAAPAEAHLTVAIVHYELHSEERKGVTSGHLSDRGTPDGFLPVYVQRSPHFRLPADDVPIIMIGAGTGIAPYRAFMQERETRGASGKSWLFFGERNFRSDFLYQTEWQELLKDGVLTRMDVAFSRDRNTDGQSKVYVQERLKERAGDVFSWLEDGAHLYVCGDAGRFAPDIHQTLRSIIAVQGGRGAAATDDYLGCLREDRRYQFDVY